MEGVDIDYLPLHAQEMLTDFAFNVIGGFAWIGFFTYAGFFFGSQPFVQKNFKLVILAIIFLSVVPIIVEFWRAWREKPAAAK